MKKLIGLTLCAILIMTAMCSCGGNGTEQNIGEDGKLQNEETIDDTDNVNDKTNTGGSLTDDTNDAMEDAKDDIKKGVNDMRDTVDDTLSETNNNGSTATK